MFNKVGIAVALLVWCLYICSMYPSISGGDSGELCVASCNLGVSHPPGYPTFTMIGYLFNKLIPFYAPAWRIAFSSTICGALAVFFIFLTLFQMTSDAISSSLAAIGFGCSFTVWNYSIQGEVFALNNLLTSLITYYTVIFFKTGRIQDCYFGAFFCGLAITNQHTTIFIILPTVLFVLYAVHKKFTLSYALFLKLGGFLFLGFLPYLYLPFSALGKAMDSWGDQRSFRGFIVHFLREEYGTFRLGAEEMTVKVGFFHRFFLYIVNLWNESGYFGAIFCVIGIFVIYSKREKVRMASIAIFSSMLFYLLSFHYLANLGLTPLLLGVQARFYMQANVQAYIFAGCGLSFCLNLSIVTINKGLRNAVVVFLFSILSLHVIQSFLILDQSSNDWIRIYGLRILDSMPKNSLLLLGGDLNNNAVKYLHQCEGIRNDIRPLSIQLMSWSWFVEMQQHHYEGVNFPGNVYHPFVQGGFSMKQFLDTNIKKFPIFLCGSFKTGDNSHQGFYDLIPWGYCDKVVRTGKNLSAKLMWKALKALPLNSTQFQLWHDGLDKKYGLESWEKVVFMDAWIRLLYFVNYISFYASKDNELLDIAAQAIDELLAIKHMDNINSDVYRNAGVVYGMLSAFNKAKSGSIDHTNQEKMWYAFQNYIDLKPDDKEIFRILKSGQNPYSGDAIE